MRKAVYTIQIRNNNNAEQILTEIDNFLIEIEKKYTNIQVET